MNWPRPPIIQIGSLHQFQLRNHIHFNFRVTRHQALVWGLPSKSTNVVSLPVIMSANKNAKEENISDNSRYPHIDLLKSPARLLAHLENSSENESLTKQLLEAAQWILCSPEAISFARLTALCYDVPTKLQDGPQYVLTNNTCAT